MKNPILSYIVIRKVPEYNMELLRALIEQSTLSESTRKEYTALSVGNLERVLESAKKVLERNASSSAEIKETYLRLKDAKDMMEKIRIYTSFKPGEKWTDTDGIPIQAHGGQVQKIEVRNEDNGSIEEKWWWIGEDKSSAKTRGICAYSSYDLYNWSFEGVVMRSVPDRNLLENDEYFMKLYGGYSREQLEDVYQAINDTNSIIERPKMIFNRKTGKYVIWFHADGPTKTRKSSYATASAGVAVSDSPKGPFRFIGRYRLNTCPPDQQDMYPQDKGMARDMNLFVDDDGTAYIIYASEENLTLYISKLNEDYTYLSAPPDKAVYGRDFIRVFPGAQREAPVVFKRNGLYYMMTSGCTGWRPNQAKYAIAGSILGEWTDMGDPCELDINRTTFDSQSTCIFAADKEGSALIYMGDRWNSNNLSDSRYIWLPLEFDSNGEMRLKWRDEWLLEDL